MIVIGEEPMSVLSGTAIGMRKPLSYSREFEA